MPTTTLFPFRVFANINLGTQYDYTSFTGEWLNSAGTGQSPVLPSVNLATGNVIIKSTHVKAQETAGTFEFGFVYNAQSKAPWSYNIAAILESSPENISFREQDGSVVAYTFDPIQQVYVSPSGAHSKFVITKEAVGSFVRRDLKTGAQKYFNANGDITAEYDARGFGIQYIYVDRQLKNIITGSGLYTVNLINAGFSLDFLEHGKQFSETLGIWNFDSNNLLKSAVIPDLSGNNYSINYTYLSETSQLSAISQTDGTVLNLNYSGNKLSFVQQGSTGQKYNFNYSSDKATITDALGFVTTATINDQKTIGCFARQVGDDNNNIKMQTMDCAYSNNNLSSILYKSTNATKNFTFNAQGLITQIIYPEGQVTQYDYDPTTLARTIKRELISGDIAHPVWATTHYVYHCATLDKIASRLLTFKISPEGFVTQYVYNNANQLIAEKSYLKNKYSFPAFSDILPITEVQMQDFVANQPVDQISLKVISENNRGLVSELQVFTTIDANGNGVTTSDSSRVQFPYYTRWGTPRSTNQKVDVDASGNDITAITVNTFDNLKRLTSNLDALGNTRATQYNDLVQNFIITEPNGRTEKHNWNDAGQTSIIATSIPESGVSRIAMNHYDTAGRLDSHQGIDGQTTYYLYDSLNRLRYTITPMGRVTENFYDDVNGYQCTTNYFNLLPKKPMQVAILPETTMPERRPLGFFGTTLFLASALMGGSLGIEVLRRLSKSPAIKRITGIQEPNPIKDWLRNLVPSTKDISTYQIFDKSKRLRFEIDGKGAVTEYRYNLRNKKTAVIHYADKITALELVAVAQNQFSRIPDVTKDRVNMTFYDLDNHIIATQDAMGFVIAHTRNPAGYEIKRYYYANTATIDLDSILPPTPAISADDYSQYYYLNAKGDATTTVDGVSGANYISAKTYFPTGKIQSEIKFANTATAAPDFTSDPATLIPESNSEDQATINQYDLLNRLTKKQLPNQSLHTHEFNNMGNEILTSVTDNGAVNPTVHATAKQFDTWGQLIREAPPLVYAKIAAVQSDIKLTQAQKDQAISTIWINQSERHLYDETTGLHIGKLDIVPDDGDINNPAKTIFYCDLDRKIVLSIGPKGQVCQTQWHPIFDKAIQEYKYANAIGPDDLKTLSGGAVENFNQALLVVDSADIINQTQYDNGGATETHIDGDSFVSILNKNMFGECESEMHSVNLIRPTLQVARTFNLRGQIVHETHTDDDSKKTISTINKTHNNLHGLCDSSSDANNAKTIFTYEPRGVLKTSTNVTSGAVTTYDHDAFSRKINTLLPMGSQIKVIYVQSTRTITINHTDSTGLIILASVSNTLDAFHNIISQTDAENNTILNNYNENNQCTNTIDAMGNQVVKQFDLRGLLKSKQFVSALFQSLSEFDYSLSRELVAETKDASGLKLKTSYAINALGQRSQTITPQKSVRSATFNKRSLATSDTAFLNALSLKATDPAVVTNQSYNGQGISNTLKQSTIGSLEAYQEQVLIDDLGRVTGKKVDPTGLALITENVLDSESRAIATIDPKNQTSYIIRDELGNIRFEINAKGGVTEHTYNLENKPVCTTQYQTAIDLSRLLIGMNPTLISTFITSSDYDHKIYYFYDDLNNERFRVNGAGAVTEKQYNKNSELTATIHYYSKITADFTKLTTDLVIALCASIENNAKDRANYRVVDANNQEVFIIDAEGYVTQKFYHSTLHKVNCEIKYATKIADPYVFSALSIAEITKKLVISGQDRATYWIVDPLDRLQFYVTANGAVTKYEYVGDTKNRYKITEFTSAVVLPSDYEALLTTLNNLVPDAKVDNIEIKEYDEAGREKMRANALNKAESFGYNGAGLRTTHTTLSGNTWNYEFDGAKRLWHEVSPKTKYYVASINSAAVDGIAVAEINNVVDKVISYDSNSNRLSIISAINSADERIVDFMYDETNQKISDTWENVPIDDTTKQTSWAVRPETTENVTRATLLSVHGVKLISFNEDGKPLFYAYDAEGFLKYRVNASGYVIEYVRNSFGEAESYIGYANQLDPTKIKLSDYITTGLTPDLISSKLVPDPDRDNSHTKTIDRKGRVVLRERDAVVCYMPSDNTANLGSLEMLKPTKGSVFNAFSEVQVEVVLAGGYNIREKYTWRDNCGNIVATVDANGIAKVLALDVRGRQTDEYRYATQLDITKINQQTTFLDLQKLIAAIANREKDIHINTPRDILGRITGVYHKNIIAQSIDPSGAQQFINNPVADIGVTYTYTDDNKIQTIMHPNGGVEILYYDERRYLVAKAGVVRSQPDGTKIRPITYYHFSAHGEHVETFVPDRGCPVDIDNNIIPDPFADRDQTKDRYTKVLKDARKCVLAHQDPENNLKQMTNTKTKKVARHYKQTTSGDPTANVTDIDEKQKIYDELDNLILISVIRNGVVQSQIAYRHDAFTLIAEGPNDGTWPILHQHDKAGRIWSDSNGNGGTKLVVHNAAGEETLTISSLSIDLSQTNYSDLQKLITDNRDTVSIYEFTETQRDPGGRPTGFVEPGYQDPSGSGNIIRPLHQLGWTAQNKKESTTTPSGDATIFGYDNRKKLTTVTEPAITVMDTTGATSTVAAVTQMGYGVLGGKIGVTDANDHTELFIRDEADQVIKHTAGDGTPYFTKKLDVHGDAIEVTSASLNTWKITYNRKGKTIQVQLPSGDTWNYALNENDFTITVVPPSEDPKQPLAQASYYGQGPYGDKNSEQFAMGEKHLYEHDPNHIEKTHTAVDANNNIVYKVARVLDYWGKELSKTDGSGATYKNTYYLNGLLYQELGLTVVDQGQMIPFDSTTGNFSTTSVNTPLKNITHNYLTSLRESEVIDANPVKPQTLKRLFDINRSITRVTETNGTGNVLRDTQMTFNARKWPVTQTDINFSLDYYYDAVSNRPRMNAICNGLIHDGWWTYDDANRVLVNDGALINAVIQSVYVAPSQQWPYDNSTTWGYLSPNQGNTFSRAKGKIDGQSLYFPGETGKLADGIPCLAGLTYDQNDRLSTVGINCLAPLPFHYEQIQPYKYKIKISFQMPYSYPKRISYFKNGAYAATSMNLLVGQAAYNLNGKMIYFFNKTCDGDTRVNYGPFDVDGNSMTTTTNWKSNVQRDDSYINDTLTVTAVKIFDTRRISQVYATRQNQHGSHSRTVSHLYDSNNRLSSAVGVMLPFLNSNDLDNQLAYNFYIDNSLDGYVLRSQIVLFNGGETNYAPTIFYSDCKGNIVAKYGIKTNSASATQANQTGMVLELTANPVTAFNVENLVGQSMSTGLSNTNDPLSLQIPNKNKQGNYTPYELFLSIINNSLTPSLQTPQAPPPKPPHHSWLGEIIEGIVAIAIIIAAPYVSAAVIGAVEGAAAAATVTAATLTATEFAVTMTIAGGIADAASQGVAIAFDNQHGFSTKEMFENAIAAGATAGLGAALGAGNLAASKAILENAAAFAEYAAIGLTVQLFEMEVGLRKSIDIKFIIEQALGQTAAGKINAELPKDSSAHATHFVDDAANMGISELFGYTPNLSTLSNMLGDQVVDTGADVIGSIKSQDSVANINIPVGASTDPTQFTNRALQTESRYINDSMAADNDEFYEPTAPFYTAYTTTLTSGVNAITSASMFAQYQAANDSAVQQKARQVQAHATGVANNASGFFNRAMDHFVTGADDVGAAVYGAGRAAYDALQSFDNNYLDGNPIKTALMLYARNDISTHFASALLHNATRADALAEVGDSIETNLQNNWNAIAAGGISGYETLGADVFVAGSLVMTGGSASILARTQIALGRSELLSDIGLFGAGSTATSAERAERMLALNTGYNVSPEKWFDQYPALGKDGTYVTDYRAIAQVIGPQRANTKFDLGLFSFGNNISYFKVSRLETSLGLDSGSLLDTGFRFTRVPDIINLSPRSPIYSDNPLFRGGGNGLPNGGPELVVNSIPTNPWP